MIAVREMPEAFREWNERWGAPSGRRRGGLPEQPFTPRQARRWGPFAWQANNSTRRFEYPWAYGCVRKCGRGLHVLEIGGGLSGLQFVLASEGDQVVNVDPGRGHEDWKYSASLHARLCRIYRAPVRLFESTIESLQAPPGSFDVVLSISALEHFADRDLAAVSRAIGGLLKPHGVVVLTVDLFLDLQPFSRRRSNEWGRNTDVCRFLDRSGLVLAEGERVELLGFPQFDSRAVLAKLPSYLIGDYPSLAQCIVARRASPRFRSA